MSVNSGDWGISPDLFDGFAPLLRSATLSNVALPGSCAAFSCLTRLKLEKDCGPLDRIYDIAPGLEELELVRTSHLRSLPSVPAASRLSKVTFSVRTLSFARLLASGYVGLRELAVSVAISTDLIRAAARDCPRSFRCALTITDEGLTTLALRDDAGRAATFETTYAQPDDVCDLIDGAGAFHTLQHLILPAELDRCWASADGGEAIAYPYIRSEGLTLPELRTLTILCGPRGYCSLLDPRVACGRLTAPLLDRIELARDPEAEDAGDALDACDLMLFLQRRIVCDAPGQLEVRIDTAGGVRLGCKHDAGEDADDGFIVLRSCVGKLVL